MVYLLSQGCFGVSEAGFLGLKNRIKLTRRRTRQRAHNDDAFLLPVCPSTPALQAAQAKDYAGEKAAQVKDAAKGAGDAAKDKAQEVKDAAASAKGRAGRAAEEKRREADEEAATYKKETMSRASQKARVRGLGGRRESADGLTCLLFVQHGSYWKS